MSNSPVFFAFVMLMVPVWVWILYTQFAEWLK